MAQHSLSLRAASTTLGTNFDFTDNYQQLSTAIDQWHGEYQLRYLQSTVALGVWLPDHDRSGPSSTWMWVQHTNFCYQSRNFCGNGPRHVQLSQQQQRSPWKISMDCPKNFFAWMDPSAAARLQHSPQPHERLKSDRLHKSVTVSRPAAKDGKYIIYCDIYHIYCICTLYIYIACWIVSMDKHGVHFLCQAAIAPRASCRIKVPEGWSCQRNSQCISAILNKSFSHSFCVFSQNRSKIIYDHLWSKMIIRWSLRCQWMSHTDMMSPWDPWIHGPSNHVAPPSKDTLMVTGPAGCGGAMQRSLTASISENLII